ncbi:sodium-independent sulfate anion transporter-like protein [Leptotrombidium deliense]|uniref:Sodium-independent sulfate anion transporter-like protein n=1 Tax=Leptotrombidium deliense TaxID=299467 RepID=A0A443SKN4_9ACAR|nr:sodium-independent sulfate anion transporter-like protein [Leptotrombidium deliense]
MTKAGLHISVDEDDDVTVRTCCRWWRDRFFTLEKLKRRFPIISWLPKYSLQDLKGDLIAGLSVAFTIIPQGLALAVLAGLPAQYGLYTSFIGCFIYALLGSCKDVAVGPTSILAILIAPYVALGGVTYAVMLSLLTGCLMLILGILNLGFIVEFISFPVISSFSSAAAITITVSQLKGFFGMHYKGSRFFPTIRAFFTNLSTINYWDMSLGILCILFLVPLQMYKDKRFFKKDCSSCGKKLLNYIWAMLVTGRNAIVVLVCAMVAALTLSHHIFTLTGKIALGLPPFQVPQFEIHNNQTDKDFTAVFGDLVTGVTVLSMVGLMETVAVAKAFTSSKKFDATQEMIASGVINIMGSFFGAFPATGSFSRSAVNHSSGVRTPLGGVVTGALVILALLTLAPFFEYIPQTALCSIIIAAVLPLIRFDDLVLVWKSNKVDVIPYFATFIASLLIGLEYGICVGVIVSLFILLYQMARPKVNVSTRMTPTGEDFLYVKPDRSVFFPSVEYLKVKINKALPSDRESICIISVVIDGEHMFRTDSTFAVGIKNMVDDFKSNGLQTIFYNLRKPLLRALETTVNIKPKEFLHSTSEEEVYSFIRNHALNTSIEESSEQNHNRSPAARYWMSQSFEAK